MGYLFWKKYGIVQAAEYEKFMVGYVRAGKSAKAFNKAMRAKGMGRHKEDYLADYRRAKATETGKNFVQKTKAIKVFDTILEPKLKKEKKWSTPDVMRWWENTKRKHRELEDLDKAEQEAWDTYEGLW